MIVGHTYARLVLERELPPAALLSGPASIGKWTLANHLASIHRVPGVDRFVAPNGLSIDEVRKLVAFSHRAPFGRIKLIQARLDGSSVPALNALLKTLEEPPAHVRFLFTASGRTLPTVTSRCVVFQLGLLTTQELIKVLTAQGMTPAKAAKAAALGRGQVRTAQTADPDALSRTAVVTVMGALARGDRDGFNKAFAGWDVLASELLSTWLTEALTHRWTIFTEAEAFGLHRDRDRLLTMVAALSRLPSARPRLGVRAALEPFVTRS